MTKHLALILSLGAISGLASGGAIAAPRPGIAMQGEPAFPEGLTALPYANPDAPQGGTLRQAIVGSFDSVNPFIVRGQKATSLVPYVFESLMVRNWAEPFSLYCRICETIDVSDDRKTFTFKLRPQAKFSDGTPITAQDVASSLQLLRDKGLPRYKNLYSSVASVNTPDTQTLILTSTDGNRELPLLIGLMPVLPAHEWAGRDFEASSLVPLTGSGPYRIAVVRPGEKLRLERNPDWWGKDRPEARGLWNFDVVEFDYYRDGNAAFEAFRSGQSDIRIETDAVHWAQDYKFPAVAEKKVLLESIPAKTPPPISGFMFNTRRNVFKDRRVREAILDVFDFEWINANLYGGVFRRTSGYFSGSELSALGHPASAREKDILGEAAASLDPALLDGTWHLPQSDGTGRDRRLMRHALGLLKEAGFVQKDGKLVDNTGQQLAFTLTLQQSREQEKLALHLQRQLALLGIRMDIRTVDSAQFTRLSNSFDFDMAPNTIYNSLSPGNEQKDLWLSANRDVEGSRNWPGAQDPALDHAVEVLLGASARAEFVDAARALDRLLINGIYMVPFYNSGGQWVARWSHIGRPDQQPLPGLEMTTLWRVPGP